MSRGKNHVKEKVASKQPPPAIKDEEEEAEQERVSYEKQAESEYEEILKGRSNPIDVKQEDLQEASGGERGDKPKKQEYVWDGMYLSIPRYAMLMTVLFENQRG